MDKEGLNFRKLYYPGPERRKSVRIYQVLPVEFVFINEHTSEELSRPCSGMIQNISAEGVLLEIDELNETWKDGLFSGMIKIAIEIKLPGSEQEVRALGRMVWLSKLWKEMDRKEKYVMGLEFVDITTRAQDLIREYIISSFFKKP